LKRIKYILALSTLAFIFTASTVYAMPWSWDMFTQPSTKGQEAEALPMPEGTVPVTGKPLKMDSMVQAARVKSPVRASAESIERGRNRYKIYCLVCHGAGGKGDGPVGKKYVPPTDLSSDYVQNKSYGEIYYAITYGGLGIMPKYADAIPPEDRWHIANYILHRIKKENIK
jgi:mono/diheme cytochrome c family protein